MKKYFLIYFILFHCYLFGNDFLNLEVLNYPNILYVFFFTIILLILLPFFVNKEIIFNKIINYCNFNKNIFYYSINNITNKEDFKKFKKIIFLEFDFNHSSSSEIGKLKEKISFKNKLSNHNYYLISKTENEIKCQKLDKNNFKNELLFDSFVNNQLLFFFKIQKNDEKKYYTNVNENLIFYFRILSFLSVNSFFKKITKLGLLFIPMLITIFFIIYFNYFTKIIELLGVVPINIDIDFYQFLMLIFSDIFIFSFSVLISFYALLIPIIILLCIFFVYIILLIYKYLINISYVVPYDSLYKFIVIGLISNVIIYCVFVFLFLIMLLKPLQSIYKIEYPGNKYINIYHTGFYYGDYQNFTSKFSKIKIKNKYVYSVGNDNVFYYYYDLEENKNKFLFTSLNNKNNLEDCNQILFNVNLANGQYIKDKKNLLNKIKNIDYKFSNAKLKSILLNNKIINTRLIKKVFIKDMNNFQEKQIDFFKDMYVNEIINKCEIMVNLKDENINYENFEKMSNKELIKWIDKLKYSQKDKINEVKSRIELEIKENKKNTN